MKTFVLSCLLSVATVVSALAAQLTVINSSDYVVHHLHVSPSTSPSWGPDQLGKQIISRAERFTVRNIPDGTYDLKLVDEDEDECIVENVDGVRHHDLDPDRHGDRELREVARRGCFRAPSSRMPHLDALLRAWSSPVGFPMLAAERSNQCPKKFPSPC